MSQEIRIRDAAKVYKRSKSADFSRGKWMESEINSLRSGGTSPQISREDPGPSINPTLLEKPENKSDEKPAKRIKRTLSIGKLGRRENKLSLTPDMPRMVDDTVHKAIRSGISPQQLNKLLRKGQLVDQVDAKGQTCLHLSVSRGMLEIIHVLLKRGANPNLQDNNGFTPLHCAAIEKQLESCKLLLTESKTINVNTENFENSSVLHYLARVPVTDENVVLFRCILDMLIKKGINVNAKNKQHEAPIHFACMTSNVSVVAFLLERGADYNIKTALGETPLHYAVRCESTKLVRMLMENGADPTETALDGSTPVDIAEQYQATDILDCFQSIIEDELKYNPVLLFSPRARVVDATIVHSGDVKVLVCEWTNCWATVNNQRLICYPSSEVMHPVIAEFILDQTEIKRDKPMSENGEPMWGFTITHTLTGESISLASDTAHERNAWVKALRSVTNLRQNLSRVYDKLKQLSLPRQMLRKKARTQALHNTHEGLQVLLAATKSRSIDEVLRLVRQMLDLSAAGLSEVMNLDDDQIIRTFAKFFSHHGVLVEFLKESITHEINKTCNGETLFREMSLSTRLLSIYLEDDGREYLKGIVTHLMNSLAGIEAVMDVPSGTVASSEQLIMVKSNLNRIMEISQNFLDQVLTSANRFPMYFRELMHHTRSTVDGSFPNMTHAVVGGFVFLRFLCPAIVAPHKYGIVPKPLEPKILRVCVLITKLLQSVSNGIEFDGSKEEYMKRLNPFIKKNRLYVNVFFDSLTNISVEDIPAVQPKILSKEELAVVERTVFEHILGLQDTIVSRLQSPKYAQ